MKNEGMFVVLMILFGVCTGGFGILILVLIWMFDSNTSSDPSCKVREDYATEMASIETGKPYKVLSKSFCKEYDMNKEIEIFREESKRMYEREVSRPNLRGIGSEHKCSDGIYVYTGGNPALVPLKNAPGAVWRGQ